jgi:chromosome segregation ATPase
MAGLVRNIPRVAIFIAGVAAGAIAEGRRERAFNRRAGQWRKALSGLEERLAAHETATTARLTQVETRIEEHAARLAELPSTAQIVEAMEDLLSKTMTSLDSRLASQAHSIDVLKTAVSQTDDLLERVLESIDALQAASPEVAREPAAAPRAD